MAIISDIEGSVLDGLEESRIAPKFWDLQNEIRPLIFEGLCEATLITGEPEFRYPANQPFALTVGNTLFSLPSGLLAVSRIENAATGLPIRKVSVFDLDMDKKTWQNDQPAAVPTEWFPFGMKQFGIHPQVNAPLNVIISGIQFPIVTDPPFTGNESFPFQSEFEDGIEYYAEHAARLKEGGAEWDAAMPLYESFLSLMEEFSKFGLRKGSLRFSRVLGSPAVFNDVATK